MLYRGMEASLMTKEKVRELELEVTSRSRDEFIEYCMSITRLPKIFPEWSNEKIKGMFANHWDHVQEVLAEAKE